jgi:DNA-binding MarR family transcriptional regulator
VSFTTEDVARLQELLVAVVADELDVRTPDELMSSTGFLVTRAQQLTHREFLTALRPLDIEPRHYGTMRVLRRCDGITQGQVSQLLEVSPATVVQMVDDLERRGLVVRERDPADRRVQRLHLTPAARTVLTKAGTPIRRMDVHFGEPGSPERLDLVRLLRLLLTGGRT